MQLPSTSWSHDLSQSTASGYVSIVGRTDSHSLTLYSVYTLTITTILAILHFINILLSPNICAFWDMETFLHAHLIFPHFQIWPVWPQKPKNLNLTNSFLTHYPQPNMNQQSPKDPKSILILIIKLLYTYFWKMLPLGALIWLAPIWLIWAQISRPTSNHL